MMRDEIQRLADAVRNGKHHAHLSDKDPCSRCDPMLALAKEYGRRRGWVLATTHFGFKTLAEHKVWTTVVANAYGNRTKDYLLYESSVADHPFCYRDRQGKAAAIVAHLYDLDKKACRDFALSHFLSVEFPPPGDFPSFYYPGATKMVVYRGLMESTTTP